MASRWEVTRAVRASDLPAPSRLVMLTLADVAEVGTAEIPARFTPSLNDLARETGLDKSTVVRHLNTLDASGWVVRTKPDYAAQLRGDPTRYRLTVPPGCTLPPEVGAQDTQPQPEVVAENDRGGGTKRQGVGAQNDRGSRTVRHKKSDLVRSNRSDSDPSSSDAPHRPDVEKVCEHLADRIVENGSLRPTITKQWRISARLMIDKDGRTVEQITRAIDWCQADSFWCGNVQSMPTLRKQYDRLRQQAMRTSRASPQNAYVERNGMRLKPETALHLDDDQRWAELDAARTQTPTLAIEGIAS